MSDALFIRREDWIAGRATISNRLLDEFLMTIPSTLTMSTGANVVDELRRTFRKDPTDLPPVTNTAAMDMPMIHDGGSDDEDDTSGSTTSSEESEESEDD